MNALVYALVLPVICALIAGVIAFLLIVWAPKSAMIDVPNSRSSHERPTPRGGGLGVVIAVLAAIAFAYAMNWIPGGIACALAFAGLVGCAGFADDLVGLSATRRLLIQSLAAAIAVACLFNGTVLDWRAALAFFGIVWATNLFNFMDGIDGIATCEAIFFATAGAAIGWSQHVCIGIEFIWICVAAASAGFLVFNWPPARIFMGDVGSGFLGFTLAAVAIAASRESSIPVEVWLILGGAFLVDASLTLVRRMIRGERWYAAHRIHAYQHLSRRWNSHRKVTLAFIAVNVIWLLPWAWYASAHADQAVLCLVISLTPLAVLALVSGAGRPE